jgi:hypothetical protein
MPRRATSPAPRQPNRAGQLRESHVRVDAPRVYLLLTLFENITF